jgi:WD40 repeat protein
VGVDGQVIEWDLTGDRRIDRPFSVAPSESADDGAPVDSIAVSADGSLLAATGTSGEVDILDSHTLTAIKQLRVEADAKLMSLAFSPDSKTLVVGGEGGPLLQRWDTASWAPVGGSLGGIPASVPQPPGTSPDAPQVSNAIRSIAYSPDGKTIAAGGLDGTIRFWDASSGAPTGATLDAGGPVWHIAFSPDGTRIVGTHVETGPPATEGQGPRRSGRATVWNIADGSQLYTVSVDDDYGSPWTAVFSHDGKTLATGGGIGFVRFWDAKTGAQIGTQILAIAGWIETLDFSADDTVLLAAGTDGTVRLLDPIGGQQLGSALPGGDRDSIATIGPDGRVFVVYQDDGHGYAWDISVTSMEAHACSVPGRTLTEAEWRHYLPDRSYDPACASPQPTSRPDGGPSAGH